MATKNNLRKTEKFFFSKPKSSRKSTHDKFSFFLNGAPIDKASQYSYRLELLSTQMEVLLIRSEKFWLKKPEDQYLLLNVILTLINYLSPAIRLIN